jgi:predicted restriction endonuclease
MSQGTFSRSLNDAICQVYGHRCAICLSELPEVSIQSAQLIDSGAVGPYQ